MLKSVKTGLIVSSSGLSDFLPRKTVSALEAACWSSTLSPINNSSLAEIFSDEIIVFNISTLSMGAPNDTLKYLASPRTSSIWFKYNCGVADHRSG